MNVTRHFSCSTLALLVESLCHRADFTTREDFVHTLKPLEQRWCVTLNPRMSVNLQGARYQSHKVEQANATRVKIYDDDLNAVWQSRPFNDEATQGMQTSSWAGFAAALTMVSLFLLTQQEGQVCAAHTHTHTVHKNYFLTFQPKKYLCWWQWVISVSRAWFNGAGW